MTLVVDDIGLLVTNDPARGGGRLGLVQDAAVVIEAGRVIGIERAGAQADEGISAEGVVRDPRVRRQSHASRVCR